MYTLVQFLHIKNTQALSLASQNSLTKPATSR